jgi:hypothetical protein
MFNPETEYDVTFDTISLRDFHDYWEDYVVRPPYQRKSVWSRKKQQNLLDSLFRRYYIPRIVIRHVRLNSKKTVREIIDGQQRITTAKAFFDNEVPLPRSLKDVHPDLAGKYYRELSVDLRKFVDKELKYNADVVKGIDDPHDPEHQRVASDIFWRLQQGETLTFMEIAHARLSSVARNFIVKYADDIHFDYESYRPVDSNPNKHAFFRVIDRGNDRMQHLALLARLLLLEESDGAADVNDTAVMDLVERGKRPDGIANESYENEPQAKATLRTMRVFYDVFSKDPMVTGGDGMRELRVEYFIISMYLLLRHLLKYYAFDDGERALFRQFVIKFHQRWKARREDDNDVLVFSDHRQQTANDIEHRQRILRQIFFVYAGEQGHTMRTKDVKRAFDEAQRILIYRRDNGLCQVCLASGKSVQESTVPWREYDADHIIPHSFGGPTDVANAQVLCRYHNQQKGATLQPA